MYKRQDDDLLAVDVRTVLTAEPVGVVVVRTVDLLDFPLFDLCERVIVPVELGWTVVVFVSVLVTVTVFSLQSHRR